MKHFFVFLWAASKWLNQFSYHFRPQWLRRKENGLNTIIFVVTLISFSGSRKKRNCFKFDWDIIYFWNVDARGRLPNLKNSIINLKINNKKPQTAMICQNFAYASLLQNQNTYLVCLKQVTIFKDFLLLNKTFLIS